MGLFSRSDLTHFPAVRGARLDGTEVAFPQDLPADATLLVVSFRDDLDPLADQWARLGDRIAEAHGGRFAVLEAPVVSSKLKWFGDLATIGIRGQVDDEGERERTVPIFVDPKRFRKAIRAKTGDVAAFLVARDGRIAWRGDGDIDIDEVESLEAAVGEVLAAPVPAPSDHPDLDADPEADDDPETDDDPEAA